MNDNGCSQWHDVTDDMDPFCHKYLDGNKTFWQKFLLWFSEIAQSGE